MELSSSKPGAALGWLTLGTALVFGMLSTSLISSARADSPQTGILDVLLESPFEPGAAFVLLELAPGQVRQYRAVTALPQGEQGSRSPFAEWSFGAPIQLPPLIAPEAAFNFTFFWASDGTNFKTSPVARTTYAEVKLATVPAESLETDLLSLEQELKEKRIELVKLRDEFETTLANNTQADLVNEIVRLRREQFMLERSLREKTALEQRLQPVINSGRELAEPDNVDEITKQISVHLKEAAQVTSIADRLNTRKKDSATQAFSRKLETVRAMENEDAEGLAREVIAARKKRRELETRLGMTSAQDAQDQF